MRVAAWIVGLGSVLAMAGAADARAQAWAPDAFDETPQTAQSLTARLNEQGRFRVVPDARFGAEIEMPAAFGPAEVSGLEASTRSDIWIDRNAFTDRLTLETAGRLRRADGSPLPVTPVDRAELEADAYDLRYVRGFRGAVGRTPSGLEVSLTPHAGFGLGTEGGSAEAGATLKIGEGLERLAPDGSARFGERARWYLYAAGSGRAVGYNFARTRDGDYARSGYTQDRGAFLGDASVGVAYRRGDVQTSVGLVYREIDAGKGLRGMSGLDTDVDEGLIAFQLSIKPRR
ncbi:lipid A-modifier LpxR family protein [uncultured Brevundimonas sp.]|uniref:lipid A-modifier LpxR family protein n=1 Tax=uncultured Brevundimonas sp. TaxID=213418 RepID=UPI002631615A|nr:lipid A-modifier LpxR family protein [uncultured Brevundimonas sp.]